MAVKVLLIDDDKNYFLLTSRMLAHTQQDFEMDWEETYENGLERILRAEHQIYLIDYNLGAKNGLQLLREAFDKGVTTPMIILTGQGEHEIDLQAIKAGAADYIDKTELKPAMLQRTIYYALERTHFARQLRDSEENYRTLLEEASDGILLLDKSGKLHMVNLRVHEMLGYDEGTLTGTNIRDLIFYPEGQEQKDDPILSDLTSGKTVMIERRMRRKDGEPLDVEISARRVSGERIQFIIRDITERKKHIEQLNILRQVDSELSQMLNIEYVLTLALDSGMRLSGANAGFIGLVDNGIFQLSQAIGHYSLNPGESRASNLPLVRRLIKDQTPRLILDVTAEPDYVEVNPQTKALMLIPLVSYERLVGVLSVETNKPERFTPEIFEFIQLITARAAVAVENAQLYKIAQDQLAQLQQLYAQVSALERIKTDMIRIAAHDLRNPVGVILGYVQLLQWELGETLNEKQSRSLASIERAARRMEKITTDILSLERIENIQLHRAERVNLSSLIDDTFRELEAQAKAKNQQYKINMPIKSIMVHADGVQLREAIANLISNAIKYTPDKGTITVSLDQVNGEAVFKVVDTGYGVPENQQANLFQPFFRANSQETSNIEGTGLGLHLVKNIVERCDGTMIFHSIYGKGSTFGFKLPVS